MREITEAAFVERVAELVKKSGGAGAVARRLGMARQTIYQALRYPWAEGDTRAGTLVALYESLTGKPVRRVQRYVVEV